MMMVVDSRVYVSWSDTISLMDAAVVVCNDRWPSGHVRVSYCGRLLLDVIVRLRADIFLYHRCLISSKQCCV